MGHWRIDAFELWCSGRLLRVPWTARRSNQSILKEINPVYSFEGLMLNLKIQYFGHLMWRADSLQKTLMLKIKGRRRSGWLKIRWLDGITDSMNMSLSKLWEIVKDRKAWHASGPWGYKELDMTDWPNNNSTWDLSFLTRNWTHILCIGRQILRHWTTIEVPVVSLLCFFFNGPWRPIIKHIISN